MKTPSTSKSSSTTRSPMVVRRSFNSRRLLERPSNTSAMPLDSTSLDPVSCLSNRARECFREKPAAAELTQNPSSDLLLIKSKLYDLEHGVLTMDKSREFGGTPVVKLGDQFKKVAVGTLSVFYPLSILSESSPFRYTSLQWLRLTHKFL